MNWRIYWVFGCLCTWPSLAAQAQPAVGDGLQGDYYQGINFERFVRRQVDVGIDFNRLRQPPAEGVPGENFSVRWTGWLLAPASGRYVLCLTVDDGARLWLNGRQLLDEWRGQSTSTYQLDLTLKAGQAYQLRLDYCQYAAVAYAQLAWVRPEQLAQQARASSWRNLWGLASNPPASSVIPTRYLFSHNPSVPVPPLAPPAVIPKNEPVIPQKISKAPTPWRVAKVAVPQLAAARSVPTRAPVPTLAAQLASGQTVTLRALYFEQGKANLLPTVQASLDTLAVTLRQQPHLRLEVQGHTDNQGDSALNRQLSQQRAEAVCRYLTTQGVAASRLQAVGFGGSRPVADNSQPALRTHNRRVVLRPLSSAQ